MNGINITVEDDDGSESGTFFDSGDVEFLTGLLFKQRAAAEFPWQQKIIDELSDLLKGKL